MKRYQIWSYSFNSWRLEAQVNHLGTFEHDMIHTIRAENGKDNVRVIDTTLGDVTNTIKDLRIRP